MSRSERREKTCISHLFASRNSLTALQSCWAGLTAELGEPAAAKRLGMPRFPAVSGLCLFRYWGEIFFSEEWDDNEAAGSHPRGAVVHGNVCSGSDAGWNGQPSNPTARALGLIDPHCDSLQRHLYERCRAHCAGALPDLPPSGRGCAVLAPDL